MNDLTSAIGNLDDATAERILAVVAQHRLRPTADSVPSLDAALAAALVQAGGETPPSAGSRGDLARATLLLLADDPARRAELDPLVANPPPSRSPSTPSPGSPSAASPYWPCKPTSRSSTTKKKAGASRSKNSRWTRPSSPKSSAI